MYFIGICMALVASNGISGVQGSRPPRAIVRARNDRPVAVKGLSGRGSGLTLGGFRDIDSPQGLNRFKGQMELPNVSDIGDAQDIGDAEQDANDADDEQEDDEPKLEYDEPELEYDEPELEKAEPELEKAEQVAHDADDEQEDDSK